MKIKHILTAMLALAAVSCEQAKFGIDEPVSDNMLKVRFATPELEVKSGSEDVSFYAYLPSELKAGTIAPIAATMQKEDGYLYYNIPEGTTDLIFSNIGNSDQDVYITAEDGRVVFKTRDEHSAHINTEIFYAELSGITTGTSTAYSIPVRRLTSIVHSELHYIDNDGNQISTHNIDYVNVFYHGWATSLTQNEDGTFTGKSYSMGSGFGSSHAINATDETGRVFIPGELVPDVQVEIQFTNGTNKRYRTSLGKVFEQNHRYNVLLRLRQLNVEGTFVLEEPSVSTVSRNPNYSKQDFFTLSEGRTVGGYADDVLTIDVSTALPYDWYISYPEEANSFFDIQVIDGQIVIRALATNENDIRSVDIEILTNEGYSKTITVNQKSSLKHRIVMTSEHTSSSSSFYISGVNMTVQDPNDTEPRTISDGENVYVSINGLSQGSQTIIEGDIITYLGHGGGNYTDDYGYKYEYYDSTRKCYYFSNSSNRSFSYSFSNCLYLENLEIHGQKAALDLSGLKSLKRFYMQNSTCTCPTFAEGQGLEHFTAYNCDALGTLDLRNVSSTIKYISCALSDNIGTINFTNFSALESVNVNSCTGANMINFTGCSSLEYVDIYDNSASALKINNCSALKELSLRSMYLSTITHEGADALETISTSSSSVTTFDFSNKWSLATVGSLSCTTLNLNNCPNLTTLGEINDALSFDISNCTSLEAADINLSTGSSEQVGWFSNCPALKILKISNMRTMLDFSYATSLEELTIDEMRGSTITSIDLSALYQLKKAYIDGYDWDTPIGEIKLPASIETLEMDYLNQLSSIDFSNSSNLKSIDLRELYNISTINLANCTALENLDMKYCFYYYEGTLNLSGCSSLKAISQKYSSSQQYNRYLTGVALDGCFSLEEFYMYNANLTSLDFTDSQKMKKLDIRNNYSMTAEAVDAMFVTLPDRSDEWESGSYQISISGFDVAAANAKNWYAIN